jgi:predicted restriction endonuclease
MWGVTSGKTGGNQKKWEKVEIGATVLFSAERRIYGCGTVAAKFHNKTLAKTLWDVDPNGSTWEWMYALAEIRTLNITYEQFNQAVGYKPNNVIQGFNVLDEVKSEAFLSSFDLGNRRIEWPPNPDDLERAIREFDELDRKFQAVQRLEQGALRNFLLSGRANGECFLCGRTFQAEFLVAAHIKKRAQCTNSEKRDLRNIGMLNCKFGCDELFERGYISVDKSGVVLRSPLLLGPIESAYASEVVLEKVAVPRGSQSYFAWHLKNQFNNANR